jgi:translation initiation factor IF-3
LRKATLTGKGKAIDRINVRINEQIRISPIRVVGADGTQVGVIPTDKAMEMARESGLDLVEVAPNDSPPVCRIMDYGKFKYQQSKKHAKGQAHHTKTKEIRLRPKTGEHDIDFKVKQASQFLQHKDKVQVSVVFRGREIAHIEEGKKVMQDVLAILTQHGKIETPPMHQGRRIVCILAPK